MLDVVGHDGIRMTVDRYVDHHIVVFILREGSVLDDYLDRFRNRFQHGNNGFGILSRSARCCEVLRAKGYVAILADQFEIQQQGQFPQCEQAYDLSGCAPAGTKCADQCRRIEDDSHDFMVSLVTPWDDNR